MRKMIRKTILCLLTVFILLPSGCLDGGPDSNANKIELVVDGGGQNTSYNSTVSMIYDKYANPYPYNTLEVLAKQWSDANPKYKIKIAETSMNNDRETMVPALNQGTAPDIIYYLPTTIAEDMSKGWFVELNEYMEQPNKYSKTDEPGSVKWKDIYSLEEYLTSLAPNGKKYTVEMEMNPIGIIYNKTLFDAAGITTPPTTYKEFMEAQDKINQYAVSQGRGDNSQSNYICPYFPYYPWYDSAIKCAIYSDMLPYYDVINVDGVVDSQEFIRAYMTKYPEGHAKAGQRLFSPNDDRAKEAYRLIKQMTKYYPAAFESYYAEQEFVAGNLAMMEVVGGTIRKLIDAVDGEFEVGVFPYPIIESQPQGQPQNPYFTTMNPNNNYVKRGLSGYSTGWAVTKTAINKGQEAVLACIDFLQFVTCYQNNDKIINDKGFAIPLSGNVSYQYFESLMKYFNEDRNSDKALAWGAIVDGASMNKEYYDAVYLTRIEVIKATDQIAVNNLLDALVNNFTAAANNIYSQNKWNINDWPPYTEINPAD